MTNAPPLPDEPEWYAAMRRAGSPHIEYVDTLRAQLEQARVEIERLKEANLGCAPNCERGDYLRSRLAAATARADANERDAKDYAYWISVHRSPMRDHACSQCVPNSNMLIKGFVCVQHRAIDAALSGAPR